MSQRNTGPLVRRLTVVAIAAATALNAVLFVQAGLQQSEPLNVQGGIISVLSRLFPGGGIRPAANPPTPSPPGSGVATTGGS